jgi:tRNA(Met) C34 N-acetyltransferase TmcA
LTLLTPESSISSPTECQVRLYALVSLFCLTLCVLALTSEELSFLFTPFDLKRIESYAQNSLDYHVILDLLPTVAMLYFEERFGEGVRLSAIQSSILLGMGLQRKSVEEVEVRSRTRPPVPYQVMHHSRAPRWNSSCLSHRRSHSS